MVAKKKKKKIAPKKKSPKSKVVAKKKKIAKKAAPAKKMKVAAKKKAPAKKKKPVRREDRAGHLDPKYAKKLLSESGESGRRDAKVGAFRVKSDGYSAAMGKEFVDEVNSGEDEKEDNEDRVEEEERGGPFVVTTGGEEFADGTDESNPADAEVEPFPKT
jgi:hypothetical protein